MLSQLKNPLFRNEFRKTGELSIFKSHLCQNKSYRGKNIVYIVQCLVNSVVENEKNQECLMEDGMDWLVDLLEFHENEEVRKWIGVLVHHCILESEKNTMRLVGNKKLLKMLLMDVDVIGSGVVVVVFWRVLVGGLVITDFVGELSDELKVVFWDVIDHLMEKEDLGFLACDVLRYIQSINLEERLSFHRFETLHIALHVLGHVTSNPSGLIQKNLVDNKVVQTMKKIIGFYFPPPNVAISGIHADIFKETGLKVLLSDAARMFSNYKTYIFQILANVAFLNIEAQTIIRREGMIPTILEHTALDTNNPFIKEQVIFLIHNLTRNNLENQEEIRKYSEVVEVDKTSQEALARSGLTLEFDKKLKKMVIKQLEHS